MNSKSDQVCAAAGPSPKPKWWHRARWAIAGWCASIYHRFIYRHLMRLSHRFNWHHTRTSYPDGDTYVRCDWCGIGGVTRYRDDKLAILPIDTTAAKS